MKKSSRTMKPSEKSIGNTALLVATLALVAAVVATAFVLEQQGGKKSEFEPQDALAFALGSAEGRQFVSANPEYGSTVSARSDRELRELALAQPVIYGNLSGKNVFEIKLESGASSAGLLLVVSEKGVEKVFGIRSVELRGS